MNSIEPRVHSIRTESWAPTDLLLLLYASILSDANSKTAKNERTFILNETDFIRNIKFLLLLTHKYTTYCCYAISLSNNSERIEYLEQNETNLSTM